MLSILPLSPVFFKCLQSTGLQLLPRDLIIWQVSGLSGWIGTQLASLDAIPSYAIVIIVCVMITTFTEVTSRGGHLGIFWVGMCRPGLQIGTPFLKKFPLKLIPRSRNGPIFHTPFQAVLDTVRRASWGKNQKRLICIWPSLCSHLSLRHKNTVRNSVIWAL